jgi:hypothetical protein
MIEAGRRATGRGFRRMVNDRCCQRTTANVIRMVPLRWEQPADL